jgi:succinate dehydrogenase hydrophobic anchor subunit
MDIVQYTELCQLLLMSLSPVLIVVCLHNTNKSYVEAQVRMDDRCFLAFSLLSLTILICRNTILSGLVGQKH